MDANSIQTARNRMIVILSESEAGILSVAYKVHWLAVREQRDVLYLTLVKDSAEMMTCARRMATMKAATEGDQVQASSKLIPAGEWLNTIKSIASPQDKLVCLEEHTVKTGFMKAEPASAFLSQLLERPVQTLPADSPIWRDQAHRWLMGAIFWLGFIAILAVFSMLEIEIDRTVQGSVHTLLLLIALGLEFGAIAALARMPRD